MVVVIWCHQATAQVMGGLRSTLMLARYFRRVEPVLITNRHGEFADLAAAHSVRCDVVRSDLSLGQVHRLRLGGRLQLAASMLRFQWRVIQTLRLHRTRILHVDYEGWWLIAPLARVFGFEVIQYLRSEPKRLTWKTWLSLRGSSRNIFISDELRTWMTSHAPSFLSAAIAGKGLVVNNSLDFDAIDRRLAETSVEQARRRVGLTDPTAVYIAMVGTICDRKAQIAFLKEVAGRILTCRAVHILIIGDADPPGLAQECEAVARGLSGGDRVNVIPFTNAVYDWFLAIDILVHYAKAEGIPRVTLEAQAFGKPVVARRIIGIDEAVRHGETGFVHSDPAAFADSVLELVRNPDLRTKLGAAGQRYVRGKFAPQIVAGKVEDVYLELAAR